MANTSASQTSRGTQITWALCSNAPSDLRRGRRSGLYISYMQPPVLRLLWGRGIVDHTTLSSPGRTRSRSVGSPTDTALLCLPTEANILLCPVPSEIPSGPSVTTPPTLYSSHQRWGVPKAEEEKAEPCSDCSLWRNPRELLLGKSLLDIRRAWGGTQTVECLGQLR